MEPSQEELSELTRKAQKAASERKSGQEAYLLVPTDIWTWLADAGRLAHPEREAEWRDKQAPLDEAIDRGYIVD